MTAHDRMRRRLARAAAVIIAAALLAVPAHAAASPQGSLRVADPTMVRDGDRWVSLSTNESLSTQDAVACDPSDPVWGKGFAYVPYRTGPSPDQLGDCYGGDALPNGPGPWAGRPPQVGMWLWAPSMAQINGAWWLFYTARKANSEQQCIGVAAGDRATGPNWLHPAQPLVCPENGWWAIDPEIFYDHQTQKWYLLWDSGPINIQEFDPATASLVGPKRALLHESHPDLGFDEFTGSDGTLKNVIENPTMIRAPSGDLWMFFSANQWHTGNYATGWAICGRGGPAEGEGCVIVNSFDPASRYKPWWGSSQRTAPVSGYDASPAAAFPDLPGFGGLSIAVPDPTSAAPQPVYATAHMYWGGPSRQRTQLVYRLDVTGLPALYEPGVVAIHGKSGTFGNDLLGATTPSGHALATRAVPDWGWPGGHNGIFNTVTDDGTLVVQGGNTDAADAMVAGGVYDPAMSSWSNVRAKTSLGFDTVAPIVVDGKTVHGGAAAWDVQAIGNAVAFTNLFGVPWSFWEHRRIPAEGVWPSFGIMAKTGGTWQIVNQWTAAELAVSNPDSDVDERACSPYKDLPGGTSLCGGPNEIALMPRSGHLIVALYAGDGFRTSGGLMALRVTGPDGAGKYGVRVVGYYAYPEVPDINPPNPLRPGNLGIAIKTVEPDPTGTLGDERFSVVADTWHADDDGDPKTIPPALNPSVTQEFRYNSATGEIRPVSAPFIAGLNDDGQTARGVHGGIYDYQGNMWTHTAGLLVYAKVNGSRKFGGPQCPFDAARWESTPESYTTTLTDGTTVWGQTCVPDYELMQGRDVGGGGYFGNTLQLAEDPLTRTIVGIDTWDTGNVLAVRHSGVGLAKTFTIGNVVDTGRNLLPRQGPPEQRPPAFDKTGRLWVTFHIWPSGPGNADQINHWVASVDLARLFEPAPIALSRSAGGRTVIQAEHTLTTATQVRPARPDGVRPVVSTGHMMRCAAGCQDDSVPGSGFMLSGTGPVEYRVWAPAAGSYAVGYQVRGTDAGAAIRLTAGSASHTTQVNTGGAWRPVAGPVVQLAAGLNVIRLASPPGGGNWQLNLFTLTRQ